MSEITYLFGAGASKNALPIVNEISSRIKNLIDFLEKEENQIQNKVTFDITGLESQKTDLEYQKEMIDCLKWMMKESENHASIDTFAKKLFIKRAFEDLEKLKITMSIFFIFEQARNKPDFRYDAFFASLLSNSIRSFPKNIQILSWNYDYQFEMSFSAYTDNEEISVNQSLLGVKSKHTKISKDSEFSILKLNGTTSLTSDRGFRTYNYVRNIKGPINIEFISSITRSFVVALT